MRRTAPKSTARLKTDHPPQNRLAKADEFGSDEQDEDHLKNIENYDGFASPTLTRFDRWNCQIRSDAWRYKTLGCIIPVVLLVS